MPEHIEWFTSQSFPLVEGEPLLLRVETTFSRWVPNYVVGKVHGTTYL